MHEINPDQAYAYHAALIQARSWFEHFKADISAGLLPYPSSIDAAISGITDVIGAPVVEDACLENTGSSLCEDCPPDGYITDKTRCEPCPRMSRWTPERQPPRGDKLAARDAVRSVARDRARA